MSGYGDRWPDRYQADNSITGCLNASWGKSECSKKRSADSMPRLQPDRPHPNVEQGPSVRFVVGPSSHVGPPDRYRPLPSVSAPRMVSHRTSRVWTGKPHLRMPDVSFWVVSSVDARTAVIAVKSMVTRDGRSDVDLRPGGDR